MIWKTGGKEHWTGEQRNLARALSLFIRRHAVSVAGLWTTLSGVCTAGETAAWVTRVPVQRVLGGGGQVF